jgi:hypothetical protein
LIGEKELEMVKLSTLGGIATGAVAFAMGGGPIGALVGFGVGKIGCKVAGAVIKAPFKILGWLFGGGKKQAYAAGQSRMAKQYQ